MHKSIFQCFSVAVLLITYYDAVTGVNTNYREELVDIDIGEPLERTERVIENDKSWTDPAAPVSSAMIPPENPDELDITTEPMSFNDDLNFNYSYTTDEDEDLNSNTTDVINLDEEETSTDYDELNLQEDNSSSENETSSEISEEVEIDENSSMNNTNTTWVVLNDSSECNECLNCPGERLVRYAGHSVIAVTALTITGVALIIAYSAYRRVVRIFP